MRQLFTPVVLIMTGLLGIALAARLSLFPQIAYQTPNPEPFADIVVWGYDLDDVPNNGPEYDITTLSVTINGHDVTLGNSWVGIPIVPPTGENAPAFFRRHGHAAHLRAHR
ncbi:MAG: hypothetical protein IIB21_04045, partial [Chloroflexi bacterium]|nr:hypothetical protein [Chloroflexota bacterium]